MTISRILLVLIAPVLLLVGCSSTRTVRVAVPPRVDLCAYPTVGLVAFKSSNGDTDIERLATQRFIQAVQNAQPGVGVVELGPEAEVLASVGRKTWDAATLRAVGEVHGVDVVVLGRLDIEKAKPQVQLSTVWKSLSARADVNATLSARLVETGSAATRWTDSAGLTVNVAHLGVSGRGVGQVGVRDAEAVYGELMDELVFAITDDFRETYVTRRVPKDQVQTAGIDD